MQHHRLISQRTHAVRAALTLTQPALDWLDEKERRHLARIFDSIRSNKRVTEQRAELKRLIQAWCFQVDAG